LGVHIDGDVDRGRGVARRVTLPAMVAPNVDRAGDSACRSTLPRRFAHAVNACR
jgi:hypothetical protein